MNLPRNLGIIFIPLFMASCATTSIERDAMCAEITQFANESSGGSTHSVELMSDYGSVARLSEDKNALYTQKCEHNNFKPGMKLCGYLVGNTSIEFARINLRHVLSCLSIPADALSQSDSVEHLEITLWVSHMRGVNPGINVGVQYVDGSAKSPPSLKIMAKLSSGQ